MLPPNRTIGAAVSAGCAAIALCAILSLRLSAAEAPPAPADDAAWWTANGGREFPASLSYADASGIVTTLNLQGPTDTRGHPFFTSLGSNGRACVTCHQPADGMSLSVQDIQSRWAASGGKDPCLQQSMARIVRCSRRMNAHRTHCCWSGALFASRGPGRRWRRTANGYSRNSTSKYSTIPRAATQVPYMACTPGIR